VDLEAFELVLLRRPEDATPYPEKELARIQQEHLAYHAGSAKSASRDRCDGD
jgi:uncharacterized protein